MIDWLNPASHGPSCRNPRPARQGDPINLDLQQPSESPSVIRAADSRVGVSSASELPSPAHKAFLATRTFGSLDGVRALCILAVIWHHLPGVAHTWHVASMGFLGVDMFFVLSGFLIVTLLLREQDRNGTISLRKFYARRTLRIFPIYYLLIFATLLFYLLFRRHSENAQAYFQSFPYLVTYTTNLFPIRAGAIGGIVWSLAMEEQFYMFWPAIEKYCSRRTVMVVLLAVIAVNQAINFGFLDGPIAALYGGDEKPAAGLWQVTFTPIALGVLLAHLLHGRSLFTRLYGILGNRYACLAFVGLLLALLQFSPPDIAGWPRLAIQLAMTALLGALVVREDHALASFLKLPPLPLLGMISYGMYLYHMYAIFIVRSLLERRSIHASELALFAAIGATTTAIAYLSFRFFERPILKLKSRFEA